MRNISSAVLQGFERAARYLPQHCAMTYLVLEDADG
jgi:hypothetical protein